GPYGRGKLSGYGELPLSSIEGNGKAESVFAVLGAGDQCKSSSSVQAFYIIAAIDSYHQKVQVPFFQQRRKMALTPCWLQKETPDENLDSIDPCGCLDRGNRCFCDSLRRR
ncbi:hypothetical protein ACYT86_22180, partial [Pseudomonas idahonensis]